MKCNVCGFKELTFLYEHRGLPTLTNRVYPTFDEARAVPTFDVLLYYCHSCGMVFNGIFDQSKIIYDERYDNNQASSPVFQQHMQGVADLLIRKGFKRNKVIEIGCGKGDFLKLLRQRGFEMKGFDPAYEGDDENIVKDYYSNKYAAGVDAGLIILRHVLEHIDSPAAFLRSVAEANQYKGSFYIEVPSFEWEVSSKAFWDIAPEHCNWFSRDVWSSIFSSFEHDLAFGGQYQYVIAELNSLKKIPCGGSSKQKGPVPFDLREMTDLLSYYRNLVKEKAGILVWGAGGKGATFVNLTDPQREFIPAVVDINVRKQGRYIAKSGHPVIGPDDLGKYDVKDVLMMNGNYKDEIRKILNNDRINLFVVGEDYHAGSCV